MYVCMYVCMYIVTTLEGAQFTLYGLLVDIATKIANSG